MESFAALYNSIYARSTASCIARNGREKPPSSWARRYRCHRATGQFDSHASIRCGRLIHSAIISASKSGSASRRPYGSGRCGTGGGGTPRTSSGRSTSSRGRMGSASLISASEGERGSVGLEELRQHGGLADVHLASRGDQRDRTPLGERAQLLQRGAVAQFLLVARSELVEPFGPVLIPLAEVLRRRNLLAPDTHPRVVPADSAGPDSIDQHALALVGADVVVDPRHPDPALGAHMSRVATDACRGA